MNFYIPIILPYSIIGELKDYNINLPINKLDKLAKLSKHSDITLNMSISIQDGHDYFLDPEIKQSAIDKLNDRVINHYRIGHEPIECRYTLLLKVKEDLIEISKSYSAPSDIYKDILFSIMDYLQSLFLLFGSIRISPIITQEKELYFNYRSAYLCNPWQIWFFDKSMLDILNDKKIFEQINDKSKYNNIFNVLQPYTNKWREKILINELIDIDKDLINSNDNIIYFSNIIANIKRQHPSHDFSSILMLLVAFIENILKIKSEHAYKFKIKISNFLKNPKLDEVLKNIYNDRCSFSHSGKEKDIDNIYHFLSIYFLFFVIRELIQYQINNKINKNSFDFAVNN